MGGHVNVIWQPWEYVIICGSRWGRSFVPNSGPRQSWTSVSGLVDVLLTRAPKHANYLDVLGVLHAPMRSCARQARNDLERHVENPARSPALSEIPQVSQTRS